MQSHAEELIYIAQVSTLVSNLLQRPSESFVRFLLGEIPLIQGRVTQRIVERFVPIVRKSIQSSLLSMMEKSFERASQHAADEPPPVEPEPEPEPAGNASAHHQSSKIVTTERELELYEGIKRICSELSDKYPIGYKDTVAYMGIHIGRPSRWFLRLICKPDSDGIASRLPVEEVQALLPGMVVDTPPSMYGTSRVTIGPTDSIQCLRPYILAAYDDIVRRTEKDTST